MTERKDHLQWCKDRANEYLEKGDTSGAFASMQSDMAKHEETANHMALEMGAILMVTGSLSTVSQMKGWINGFN